MNFNPRSHERSDVMDGALDMETVISIHAPTRGATDGQQVFLDFLRYFNPRSHERSDDVPYALVLAIIISIHAPTRGATGSRCQNPTQRQFQSTLPREERRSSMQTKAIFRNFNPRSHERSDQVKCFNRLGEHISIHAPTRGATDRVFTR